MTSIFRCVRLLKIPLKLAINHDLSQVIESSTIQKSMKRCMFHEANECIKPIFQNKYRSFSNKELMQPIFKPSTIYQTKKCFSSKKHKPYKQSEGKEKSKRDEVCGENCVTVKSEKPKKRIRKDGDLKFIVNLNNLVNEMVRNHACRKMEQINKLHNFIFKPTNCSSCIQRKKAINNGKVDQQKRYYSTSATKKNFFPNIPAKKKEHNQLKVALKTETIYLPFVMEKLAEKKSSTVYAKDSCEVTKGGIVPLYLLVKSSSRKSKTDITTKKSFQYRVGTNHAFVPLEKNTNSRDFRKQEPKRYTLSSAQSNDSFFSNQYPLIPMEKSSPKLTKFKSEIKFRLQENFLKPPEERKGKPRRDLEFNAMLAEVVRKVLGPLLQKEQLKYSEVKKAIERLEKKVETYLEKEKNCMPDDNITRSLTNLYSLLMKQNQPDPKTEEIKDPLMYMNIEIKDPFFSKEEIKEPRDKNYNLTLPCIIKGEMREPTENVPMLASDCSDKKKKENKHISNKEKDACERHTAYCEKKNSNVDNCSNDKQKKEKVAFQKPKVKFEDLGFNQKALMPCQRRKSCESQLTNFSEGKNNCSSDCVHSERRGSISESALADVDIYKKKDTKDIRNIGYPAQSGRIEVAQPCPTKLSDTCTCPLPQTPCSGVPNDCPLTCEELEKQLQAQQLAANQCSDQTQVKEKPCLDKLEDKNKPMGPSEIICQQQQSLTQRKCCEEVILCEKSNMKYSQPKCQLDQPVRSKEVHLTDKQVCDASPVPDKCKLRAEEMRPPKGSYIPTPVQRPCDAHRHEPLEPPNCCKSKFSQKPTTDSTFKDQITIMEKCSTKQIPCSPPKKSDGEPKSKEIKHEPCSHSSTPSVPSPPKTEAFINYSKIQLNSETLAKSLCKSKTKTEPEKPNEIEKTTVPPPPPQNVQECVAQKREPQQSQKRTWLPFKLGRPKKKKIKCGPPISRPLKKGYKSGPDHDIPKKQSTTKCSAPKPKPIKTSPTQCATKSETSTRQSTTKCATLQETSTQNGFVDNCKGFFRNVCRVFCPGKYNSKKKADSVFRHQSMSSMTQGRIDIPCFTLPGSADNSGSKKRMHTHFMYNTKIKKKYPWKQDKEVPRYIKSYFSTSSPRVSVLPSSMRFGHFDPEQNALRRTNRKTLTFKLVNYKQFSGFPYHNFGHRRPPRNFPSSQVANAQKRTFCEARTENDSTKLKKDLCSRVNMTSKNNRKNRYPWKKVESEMEDASSTNQCYLTKKSFENGNLGNENCMPTEPAGNCPEGYVTESAVDVMFKPRAIRVGYGIGENNSGDCLAEPLDNEKIKLTGVNCSHITVPKKSASINCEGEQNRSIAKQRIECLERINEKNRIRKGSVAHETDPSKKCYNTSAKGGEAFGYCDEKRDVTLEEIEKKGDQIKSIAKQNIEWLERITEAIKNGKGTMTTPENDLSTNLHREQSKIIGDQNMECLEGITLKHKIPKGTTPLEIDPSKKLYNTSAKRDVVFGCYEEKRDVILEGIEKKDTNATRDEEFGCCEEERNVMIEVNENKVNDNEVMKLNMDKNAVLLFKLRADSRNSKFDEKRSGILKSKGYTNKMPARENLTVPRYKEGSFDNRLITSPCKFSLVENAKRSKSSSKNPNDFEGLACVIELPLTSDGQKQRTEIRISCNEGNEHNIHKQGGNRGRKILEQPHEVAKIQRELEKIKLCPDNVVLFCKAVKTGKTEILICKTKEQWECTKIEDENIDVIARILRGIIIKDECNRDVLICQEVKVKDCDNSKEEQEIQMKELIRKARFFNKQTKLQVYVSNRMFCKEKLINNSDEKEIECRIMQVKELVGSPYEISATQQSPTERISSNTDSEVCNQSRDD